MGKIGKIFLSSLAGGLLAAFLTYFPSPIFLLFFYASLLVGVVAALLLCRMLGKNMFLPGPGAGTAVGALTGLFGATVPGFAYAAGGGSYYENVFFHAFNASPPLPGMERYDFALACSFYFFLITFVQIGSLGGFAGWYLMMRRSP